MKIKIQSWYGRLKKLKLLKLFEKGAKKAVQANDFYKNIFYL